MSVIIASITDSIPAFLATASYSSVVVLADTNTEIHCYPHIQELLPEHLLITVPEGEQNKNLTTCEYIWGKMTDAQLDRHALMINLGGGVIGDMGGFCASTYKRGIDFIQIPTTLLSQVDASVGGKLGIDFRGFKNHLGVFTLPNQVIIDPIFLESLSERELRSGFAEVIKHCLIHDAEMFETIRHKNLEEQDLQTLIAHSVEIKKAVVAADPTEKGLRKILNFGHTLGHAVETYFLDKDNQRLLHGEAIAAGMIMESYLAWQKGSLSEESLEKIENFFVKIYGKVAIPTDAFDAIIQLTKQDKKNKGTDVRFSLIEEIGNCRYDVIIDDQAMKEALAFYAK